MKPAPKRILWGLAGISFVAGLCFLTSLVWHFYFLLPNSDQVFRWRHNYFSHLEMYTDQYGYNHTESIAVAISSAPEGPVDLLLYDVLREDTLWRDQVQARFQSVSNQVSIHGTKWDQATILPWKNIPPGWYVLEARNETFSRRTSVFLQPDSGKVTHQVALLLSTHTWNAYNYWGGHSIYTHQNHTPTVSFQRPQLLADPYLENTFAHHQLYYQGANKDRNLAELLNNAGIGYDVYSMMDLERGDPRLQDYQVMVMATHSEYWSDHMLDHLNALLDSGTSLICLAGNVAAFRTTYDTTEQTMTVFRDPGELWQTLDTVGRRPFGQQAAFLGFHTYAPYQVRDTSWLLSGTHLRPGDLLGEKSETYDYTYMYISLWDNVKGLLNRGKPGAASGLEVDVPYEGTPENWVQVAHALNPAIEGVGQVYPDPTVEWDGASGPDLGYYWHPGGGLVLSVGSMAFTGALPYDANLRKLVLNAIDKGINH